VGEHRLDVSLIRGTGPDGRITKGDVLLYIEQSEKKAAAAAPPPPAAETICPPCETVKEEISGKPMTPIRRRIAERLLKARQNTAMLTTFNDVDMSAVIELRKRTRKPSRRNTGLARLHVLFIKASVEALKAIPKSMPTSTAATSSTITTTISAWPWAPSAGWSCGHPPRGPAELRRPREGDHGFRGQDQGKPSGLNDLEGGTFTITNGGVFGSLLSTPILNTPRAGSWACTGWTRGRWRSRTRW